MFELLAAGWFARAGMTPQFDDGGDFFFDLAGPASTANANAHIRRGGRTVILPGQYYDSEDGFMYNMARIYDPLIGGDSLTASISRRK